jgi:hypothetical protein
MGMLRVSFPMLKHGLDEERKKQAVTVHSVRVVA